MTNKELIDKAASVVRVDKIDNPKIGRVGCAIVSIKNNIYLGTNIDVRSGMGFCSEHNAVGTMVTNGEFRIVKIVAVKKDDTGKVSVLVPCGRCRDFLYQINYGNLDTEVILSEDNTVKLSELLPYHD